MDDNVNSWPDRDSQAVDHGTSVTPEQIAIANELRVRRHQLQHALMRMTGTAAGGGEVASPSDVAWVHDLVMSRPFMAQIVTSMFRHQRRLNCCQVVALRNLDTLVTEIERLAAELELDNTRIFAAAVMRTVDL